jgi:hypothetical protein
MVKLVKIEKLSEMTKYEDQKTADVHHGGKKWTKGVSIILVDKEGNLINTEHWVYINNNDELVYNKRKNLWTQGSEWFEKGRSNIKEVYVVVNE